MSSPTSEDRKLARQRAWHERLRRPEQVPPEGEGWTWYIRGGRGSGKTRAGAEGLADAIIASILADDTGRQGDWAVIAPTFGDARDTCMEGASGLRDAIAGWTDGPWAKAWNRSQGQLRLINGARVYADGADDGALRIQGRNLRGVWADEVGLWRKWEQSWDESIAFAVRMPPAIIIATGTPKGGHGLVRRLVHGDPERGIGPASHQTHMRTMDNRHLSADMIAALQDRYGGTTLGRQELEGELLTEVEGALWTQGLIDTHRMQWPKKGKLEDRLSWASLRRIVVAVDPPGGATEAGIVVAGITHHCPCEGERMPHAMVVEDASRRGTPDQWGSAAVSQLKTWTADRIVAEVNYGGDMVEKVIASVDASAPFKTVRATRGKAIRAEPVVALYEQGRVHHVGTFGDLESEMTTWTPGANWSPNRVDALTWAIHDLEIESRRPIKLHGAQLIKLRIAGDPAAQRGPFDW